MKTCNGCKYAVWQVTKAGKLHPSGEGKCTVTYKVPPLPRSMYWIMGIPRPAGGYIERKKVYEDHCPYYVPSSAEGRTVSDADNFDARR